jgi:hypothetical protein
MCVLREEAREIKVLAISVITKLENLFADILCTADTNVGILLLS